VTATAEDDGAKPNYWPNSRAGAPLPDENFVDPAWKLGETIVDRFDSTVDHDDYTQAGDLFRMFDDGHRDRLATKLGIDVDQVMQAMGEMASV
jgi:catalase